MSVVVILEFRVRAGEIEDAKKYFKKILVDTRAYDGCEGLDVYGNQDDPASVVFYERWKTKEQYQKYLAWRTENGSMAELAAKLDGAPQIRYFERWDV